MTTMFRAFVLAVSCATPMVSVYAADAVPAPSAASTSVTPVNVPAPTTAEASLGPQELMQKVADDLLDELNANREALKKDPAGLRSTVHRSYTRTSSAPSPMCRPVSVGRSEQARSGCARTRPSRSST